MFNPERAEHNSASAQTSAATTESKDESVLGWLWENATPENAVKVASLAATTATAVAKTIEVVTAVSSATIAAPTTVYPSHWSPMASQRLFLVSVETSSPEWRQVEKQLHETLKKAKLVNLRRIQNADLWQYYCMRKQRMQQLSGGAHIVEKHLWHGTRQTDPALIYNDRQDGFCMQYSNQGMWGRGIYFAENASYSHNYASRKDNARVMMLARLLVGDAVNIMPHDTSLKLPPRKPALDGIRFDTVTGVTNNGRVYIVYENGRAYPEYLVEYFHT
eukprot:SAG31_NODE_398_length_16250_cov_8.737601_14_plen_276_part_00